MPRLFSIEANIGTGKSTLLPLLEMFLPEVIFVPEPVNAWDTFRDVAGKTLLENYYENPPRHAFAFQMMAFISRVSELRRQIERVPPNAIIITERSVHADRNVFAQMLYDDGTLSEIEYKIYTEWFNELTREFSYDGFIYLDASPSTCLARVNHRNRKGETIPLTYLQRCDAYHREWISTTSVPTLTIDYALNFNDKKFVMANIVAKIQTFIQ